MADPERPALLTTSAPPPDRYDAIAGVLRRVLVLNLLVAAAEIVVGALAGSVSVMSGGFHSLTDGASNVVALVGISIARRPPDANHPYGHRKFETMASIGILVFLTLVIVEVVTAAVGRLRTGEAPVELGLGLAVVVGTLVVNLFVVRYELREGARLRSEILRADARHTRADVMVSFAVLAALGGVWLGYPLVDPLASLVVAVLIARAGWLIATDATRILSDEIALAPDHVRAVVQGVPDVIGCEKIRTRGSSDHVFLDLHLWVDGRRTLEEAHATSHIVKARLMDAFPQLADVIIHIEPPPSGHS